MRLSQGEKVGVICRRLGISEQSYYRWRREYGGLKVDQAQCVGATPVIAFGRIAPFDLANFLREEPTFLLDFRRDESVTGFVR